MEKMLYDFFVKKFSILKKELWKTTKKEYNFGVGQKSIFIVVFLVFLKRVNTDVVMHDKENFFLLII
jgi:hypothetical protein